MKRWYHYRHVRCPELLVIAYSVTQCSILGHVAIGGSESVSDSWISFASLLKRTRRLHSVPRASRSSRRGVMVGDGSGRDARRTWSYRSFRTRRGRRRGPNRRPRGRRPRRALLTPPIFIGYYRWKHDARTLQWPGISGELFLCWRMISHITLAGAPGGNELL